MRKNSNIKLITLIILILALIGGLCCSWLLASYARTGAAVVFVLVSAALLAGVFALGLKFAKTSLVLSIVFLLLTGTMTVFGIRANDKLSGMEASSVEYETVQIAAVKGSGITADSDFSDLGIGYVTAQDNVYDRFTEILNDHDKKVHKSYPYEKAAAAYSSVMKDKTQLIVLTSFVRAELGESDPAYMDKLDIIFEKEFPLTAVEGKPVDISKEPFTIYLQGTDYSAGSNINSASRGDANILVTVNPVTEKVNMQVIPRDTFVYVESVGGRTKLSYSGVWGGVQSSINSIENEFGIDINYYAKINFQGVTDMVDALGGVSVYSRYDFTCGGYSFHEGYNDVDGDAALNFVRSRKNLPENELSRGQNQMEMLKAMITKFSENPDFDSSMAVLDAISDNFVTNIPKEDYMKAFKLAVKLYPQLTTMENHSMDGEYKWHTDEVNPETYKYYYYPAEGEKERIRDDIEKVLEGK